MAELESHLSEGKSKIEMVKKQMETFVSSMRQLEANLVAEEHKFKELEEEYRIQKKIFIELLPDAANNIKLLQEISQASTTRLLELATEWEQHRLPRIEAIRKLRDAQSNKNVRARRDTPTRLPSRY